MLAGETDLAPEELEDRPLVELCVLFGRRWLGIFSANPEIGCQFNQEICNQMYCIELRI